jgi:ferritin-like metal-binding protein YciE
MTLTTVQDVFADQVADLRSAETQLVEALPKMADAATDEKLKQAFTTHLQETRGHLGRIEEIVSNLDTQVPSEECEAMKGLISEGEEIIANTTAGPVRDVALIAAAQRVEHYEISAYGSAKALAKELGFSTIADRLDDTLDEESHADDLLTKIATGGLLSSGVNQTASEAPDQR